MVSTVDCGALFSPVFVYIIDQHHKHGIEHVEHF